MKTVLYYFSGTGNCQAAARQLARRLHDCRICAVEACFSDVTDPKTLVPELLPAADEGRIGFVFPVYFMGLPRLMHRFAALLPLTGNPQLFAVSTAGGGPTVAMQQLDAVLKKKNYRLHMGCELKLAGNYLPFYEIIPESEQQQLAEQASRDLEVFAGALEGEQRSRVPSRLLRRFAALVFFSGIRRRFPRMDRRFRVSDSCTGCGLCYMTCPVKNIAWKDARPVWLHRCEQCWGCVHICPEHAIDAGGRSAMRKRRYRHPDVPQRDLIRRKLPAKE